MTATQKRLIRQAVELGQAFAFIVPQKRGEPYTTVYLGTERVDIRTFRRLIRGGYIYKSRADQYEEVYEVTLRGEEGALG